MKKLIFLRNNWTPDPDPDPDPDSDPDPGPYPEYPDPDPDPDPDPYPECPDPDPDPDPDCTMSESVFQELRNTYYFHNIDICLFNVNAFKVCKIKG